MWYGHWHYGLGPGNGWWIVMVIFMVLFWSVIVLGVLMSLRHFRGDHHLHHDHALVHGTGPYGESPAVAALKLRFAKGEIDEDEFTRRLALLEQHPTP